jgi:putative spermidine/putrescine transport system permease protein
MNGTHMIGGRILPTTVVGLILLFLAFPIVVVIVVSFSSATYLTFPPPAFGLRWYSAYFGSEDWLRPTWLSLWVAAATVALATLLGTLAALGIARLPRALRVVAAGLILSPLIVPVIVVAIGIYYAFSRYGLVGSPIGLVLAHTCLAVPFVVTSVSASLAGIDPRLEQAALSLGATPGGTFFQVTLPLIRPGVLVGACSPSSRPSTAEFVALSSPAPVRSTLPRRMWDDLRFRSIPRSRRLDPDDRADGAPDGLRASAALPAASGYGRPEPTGSPANGLSGRPGARQYDPI